MVGFPGETEEDFQELLSFVKEMRFEHLGCFTYSQEEGTVAGRMSEQIDDDVKERRYNELMSLQQGISRDKLSQCLGKTYPALVQKKDTSCEARWEGRLSTQAPDVDGVVYIQGDQLEIGQIVDVHILETLDYDFIARA